MAKVITTEELKKKMDEGGSFHIVDARLENGFKAQHIPGAINIPNGPDFLKHFEEKIDVAKDAEIIVYCSSATCMASVQAADTLEKAGYSKVLRYKDGVAGWQNAGYQFEGETVSQ